MSKPVDGVLPNGFWAKGAGMVEGCGLQQGRAQLHIKWMWSELGADGEEGDAGWPAPACTPSHPAPMLALTKVRGHGAC
jgi:hypothetical protein